MSEHEFDVVVIGMGPGGKYPTEQRRLGEMIYAYPTFHGAFRDALANLDLDPQAVQRAVAQADPRLVTRSCGPPLALEAL